GDEKIVAYPTECPSCGTRLVREEDEAAWRCPNWDGCKAQILQRMIFHVSKDAMDIDGFGEKFVLRFYEEGMIRNLADIYRLDYDRIATMDGFGKKSADKLKASIEKAMQNPIQRLLHSLSIHHLGQRASKLIAERVEYVPDLANWTIEDYTAIREIGPVVANNAMRWFTEPAHIEMLREMESLGVNMRQTAQDKPKVQVTDGVFSGKNILFTGTLT